MDDTEQQNQQSSVQSSDHNYPVRFDIDYAEKLGRWSTFFRIILVIPVLLLFTTVAGGIVVQGAGAGLVAGAGGLLFLGPLLMILFRKHYPTWWFNWNLELTRFQQRLTMYFYCLIDVYPSVEGDDSPVHLDIDYPQGEHLSRGMPIIKWFLAIPHYVVLLILGIFTTFVLVIGWICVLFVGRYPRSLFNYVVGYFRWVLRVYGYAFLLVTDRYPPFSLKP